MEQFRFFQWQIYRDAKELFTFVKKLVNKLPKEYRFEIGSQIIRSALSVVLNIAEGSGKQSDKELNRFLEIALGSLYEVLATLDVMKDENIIPQSDFDYGHQSIKSIAN